MINLRQNPITHNTVEEIMKNLPEKLPHLTSLELNLDNTLINDTGIYYISDALDKFGP